jgi:hypothetical protein
VFHVDFVEQQARQQKQHDRYCDACLFRHKVGQSRKNGTFPFPLDSSILADVYDRQGTEKCRDKESRDENCREISSYIVENHYSMT